MSKIVYVYSFNIRNHKDENDIAPLGVDVLIKCECKKTTNGYTPFPQYIKRYLDLDQEKIQIEVLDNPYFKEVEIIGYSWGSNGGEGEWEHIDKKKADEIVKKYCRDVKENNIYFEKTGENVAYYYLD